MSKEHAPTGTSVAARLTGKAAIVGLTAVAGALALIASMQEWVGVKLLPGVATVEHVEVTGQKFNSALTLIALAALAAALVLMIAGRGFRRVIGVLVFALGVGLAAIGVFATIAPLDGARRQLAEVSGIAGSQQETLVSHIAVSAWPAITAVLGAILALAGVLVLAFGGNWATGGRKYDTGATAKRERTGATGDRISDWDSLSDGDDPTGDDSADDSADDDSVDDTADDDAHDDSSSDPAAENPRSTK